MSESFPDIKSVIVRVLTDKPVRKTPYQVKGVFMRQYPDEPVIPMLDGTYRDRFLYPRVQVKILNEQIYIIGIHEGADAVLSLAKKFDIFDFGNITFEVKDYNVEETNQQFVPSSRLVRYRFLTPWVALNHMTGGRYRFLTNQEKPSFLNRLLGQNIIFLANEVGIRLEDEIYTKVKVTSLFPRPVDENKWGAFMGEFKTNFVLPNYIGIGNGITRGYGTVYGMFNPEAFSFDEDALKKEKKDTSIESLLDQNDGLDSVTESDVPKPKRRRSSFQKKDNKGRQKKESPQYTKPRKSNQKRSTTPRVTKKRGRVFSEEFDIEHENPANDKVSDNPSESREDAKFNSEKYHKRQHKF
ncbi:uncharacterized protein METZ01_LOCUS80760 [marine metagenome]|uniref:Cas6b C-terminal domain-containing protein n=1 Tax=marine metagenome TaxID=408172 RepID=A0A381UI68_9ZZZZ